MTHMKFNARYVALVLGVVIASSCDTRLPTQSGGAVDDVERPQVKFSFTGALNNAVALGSLTPLVATISATDNKGVTSVQTTVRNGATIIAFDTVTVKPASLVSTRTVPIPLLNVVRGDKIVVRTTVTDVALNTRTDSVIISVAAPAITFLSPAAGSKLNVGV